MAVPSLPGSSCPVTKATRAGHAPLGDRDPGVGGRGDAGGHARDHLEGQPRGAQRLRLLAAAPEDERVAALEADDAATGADVVDQQAQGLLLGDLLAAADLAHVDELGVRRRVGQRLGRRELVEEDDVGLAQDLDRPQRQQPRVARARPRRGRRARSSAAPAPRPRTSSAPAARSRRATSAPSASGSPAGPSRSSRTQAAPSSRPTNARSAGPARPPRARRGRRPAWRSRPPGRGRRRARPQAGHRRGVGDRRRRRLRPLVAGPRGSTSTPWPAAGTSASRAPPASPARPSRCSPARARTIAS